MVAGPGEAKVDVPVAGAQFCGWQQGNPPGQLGVVFYPATYSLESARTGYPISDPITVNGLAAFETYPSWADPSKTCLVLVETRDKRLVMAQYSWFGLGETDRTTSCQRVRSFAELAFETLSR